MEIRRLGPADVDVLRDVRLRALTDAPEAFWTTYEREAAYGRDEWCRWLEMSALFAAGDGVARADGIAGGMPDPGDPNAAFLISMWVASEHRGSGLADRLVAAVKAWAVDEGRPTVRLHVEEHQRRARRFYERVGFRLTGRRLRRERDDRWELEMEAVAKG